MELFSTNKLFKEEKYEEILALWQNDESKNRMTDWDKWYVLLSLNKQKRYQETLDAYKLLRAKRDESSDTNLWQRIEDAVCWALYYAHVKTFDFRQGGQQQTTQTGGLYPHSFLRRDFFREGESRPVCRGCRRRRETGSRKCE